MYSYKPGDKVRFLNDVGRGVITKILNKEMALVKNEEDWEIPMRISELIPDVNAFYSPEDRLAEEKRAQTGNSKALLINKKLREEEELELVVAGRTLSHRESIVKDEEIHEVSISSSEEEKFFEADKVASSSRKGDLNAILAYVPVNPASPESSNLVAFLINDSSYDIHYQYAITYKANEIVRDSGILEAETKIYIETYRREDLNELSGVRLQLTALNPGGPTKPIQDIQIQIQSVRFYKSGSYVENEYFDQACIMLDIKQAAEKKELNEKMQLLASRQAGIDKNKIAEDKKPAENHAFTQVPVIDLHIEQLSNRHESMNNIEMLNLQMDTFRVELQRAYQSRVPKVVFIHGVGNGILKQEITNELMHKHKAFRFQDASFQEYGYGATLVYLRPARNNSPNRPKRPN